ncbi:hypothetical protein FNF27_05376 [Cafeteria roenbergensis]|uniref:Uncharacterized protein n=1 Tax=Cafeteria roenbergensis TaxID=33653 RepID=A0A5A8E607_CAFRO|nr:hypothetical protein FNF27_05376 [Cafeteria roenbergensis]
MPAGLGTSDIGLLVIKRALRLARQDLGVEPDVGFDLDTAVRILEHSSLLVGDRKRSSPARRPRTDSASESRGSSSRSLGGAGPALALAAGSQSPGRVGGSPGSPGRRRGLPADSAELTASAEGAAAARAEGRRARAAALMRLAVEDAFQASQLPFEARAGDATPRTTEACRGEQVQAHALRGPLRKLPGGRMVIRGARLLASAMRRFEEMQGDEAVDPLSTVLHLNINWQAAHMGVSRSHGGAFDLPGYDSSTGQLQVKQALKMWRSSMAQATSDAASSIADTPSASSVGLSSSARLHPLSGSFAAMSSPKGSATGPDAGAPAAAGGWVESGCGVQPCFEAEVRSYRASMEAGDTTDGSSGADGTATPSPAARGEGWDPALAEPPSVAGPEAAPGTVPLGTSCALSPVDPSSSLSAQERLRAELEEAAVASAAATPTGEEAAVGAAPAAGTPPTLGAAWSGGSSGAGAGAVGSGLASRRHAAPVLTRSDTAYKRAGLSANVLAAFLEFFGLDLGRLPSGRAGAVRMLAEEVLAEPEALDTGDTNVPLSGRKLVAGDDGSEGEWRVCGSHSIKEVLRRFNVRADAEMDGHSRTTREMALALPLPPHDREATDEEDEAAAAFLEAAEAAAKQEREARRRRRAASLPNTDSDADGADTFDDFDDDEDHIAGDGADGAGSAALPPVQEAGSELLPSPDSDAGLFHSDTSLIAAALDASAGSGADHPEADPSAGGPQPDADADVGAGDGGAAAAAAGGAPGELGPTGGVGTAAAQSQQPALARRSERVAKAAGSSRSVGQASAGAPAPIKADAPVSPAGQSGGVPATTGPVPASGPGRSRPVMGVNTSAPVLRTDPATGEVLDSRGSGSGRGCQLSPTLTPGPSRAANRRSGATTARAAVIQAAVPSWTEAADTVGSLQAGLTAAEERAAAAEAAAMEAEARAQAAESEAERAGQGAAESQRQAAEAEAARLELERRIAALEAAIESSSSSNKGGGCCAVA